MNFGHNDTYQWEFYFLINNENLALSLVLSRILTEYFVWFIGYSTSRHLYGLIQLKHFGVTKCAITKYVYVKMKELWD